MIEGALPTTTLGRTGVRVSRIGLGLAALGRPAYINLHHASDLGHHRDVGTLERRCHDVLDTAFDAGIRYIDAARSYGRAEHFLGHWLRAHAPEAAALTIGSKWGYTYVGDWRVDAPTHEVKDLSVATLRRQIDESKAALGRHLALYQIHSATMDSGVLDDQAVLGELARLRGDGLVIGLSVTGPDQADTIRKALTISFDGVPLFQSVQATWNLLEPSSGPALAEAHAAGLGVIVKEAMANGRLLDTREPATAIVAREAARLGTTPDAYALAAALAYPWADSVLSGAATIGQLQSNLDALRVARQSSDWPEMAEPPEAYWKTRGRLVWN